MSVIFRFPTNVSMDVATQEYFIQRDKMVGDEILPFQDLMTQRVQWDELDSEVGMTAPHNMRSDPRIDNRPGSRLREYVPIPFKETEVITEDEMLQARAYGTLGGVVDLSQLIGQRIRAREDKTFIRAEWCRWQALRGRLQIAENGVVVDESFPVQTYDVITDWDNRSTATPLRDDNAVALLFDGTGASAEGAIAYANRKTINMRLENANASDLQGFRGSNFRNVTFSLNDMNKIQEDRGLPTYKVYHEGYIGLDRNFHTYLQDGEVIVIGKRPAGQKVGDFGMTPTLHRTKNGLPAPGFFSILEVNGDSSSEVSTISLGAHKNPKVEITGGVYGGPRIKYPRSVVRMTVKH